MLGRFSLGYIVMGRIVGCADERECLYLSSHAFLTIISFLHLGCGNM
jgi:hypothetical protein